MTGVQTCALPIWLKIDHEKDRKICKDFGLLNFKEPYSTCEIYFLLDNCLASYDLESGAMFRSCVFPTQESFEIVCKFNNCLLEPKWFFYDFASEMKHDWNVVVHSTCFMCKTSANCYSKGGCFFACRDNGLFCFFLPQFEEIYELVRESEPINFIRFFGKGLLFVGFEHGFKIYGFQLEENDDLCVDKIHMLQEKKWTEKLIDFKKNCICTNKSLYKLSFETLKIELVYHNPDENFKAFFYERYYYFLTEDNKLLFLDINYVQLQLVRFDRVPRQILVKEGWILVVFETSFLIFNDNQEVDLKKWWPKNGTLKLKLF